MEAAFEQLVPLVFVVVRYVAEAGAAAPCLAEERAGYDAGEGTASEEKEKG